MTLRIRDWDKHFENNRTRELKKLSWVPFPNKHDGDGYTELVDHKDGVAHFGCWCLICEVASKCDPRGTLLRDDKTPHTFETIARMTRASATDMRSAIERLISIGWIESCDNPAPSCDLIPHPHAQKGIEGKGTEQQGTPACEAFDQLIPEQLKDGRFIAAWHSWVNDRKERRKALTIRAAELQLSKLKAFGVEKAIRALDNGIEKSWSGIFDPDGQRAAKPVKKAGGIKISEID